MSAITTQNREKQSLEEENKKLKEHETILQKEFKKMKQLHNQEKKHLKKTQKEQNSAIDKLKIKIDLQTEEFQNLKNKNVYNIEKSRKSLKDCTRRIRNEKIQKINNVFHKVCTGDENYETPALSHETLQNQIKDENQEYMLELNENIKLGLELLIHYNETYIGRIAQTQNFKNAYLRAITGGTNLENEFRKILLDMFLTLSVSEHRFDQGVTKQLKILERVLNSPNMIVGAKTLQNEIKTLTADFEIYKINENQIGHAWDLEKILTRELATETVNKAMKKKLVEIDGNLTQVLFYQNNTDSVTSTDTHVKKLLCTGVNLQLENITQKEWAAITYVIAEGDDSFENQADKLSKFYEQKQKLENEGIFDELTGEKYHVVFIIMNDRMGQIGQCNLTGPTANFNNPNLNISNEKLKKMDPCKFVAPMAIHAGTAKNFEKKYVEEKLKINLKTTQEKKEKLLLENKNLLN